MRRDGQHRYARAVRVVQPVDQVQVTRATTGSAYRELTLDRGIASGGERGRFLVTDVLPGDRPVLIQRVGEAVERIAGDAVDALNPSALEGFDDQIGHRE
jgi:hypothetical protein